MIKNTKLLITIACLTVILCTLITGTIAWLTAKTSPITNTFAPSNIGLVLAENTGNRYKMIPGETISKNPSVTVSPNSEACYLFVKVEKSANFDSYMACAIADGWTELTNGSGVYYREVNADTATSGETYGILGAGSVSIGGETIEWGKDEVLVRPDITKDMMESLYDGSGNVKPDADLPNLTFTAYAIQSEGFDDEVAAWTEASKIG